MTMQLKAGTSLRWIRAIWLTVLLSAFGLLAAVSVFAFSSASPSFSYDGQNQPRIGYDETLFPAFNYDRASFRRANESAIGPVEMGGVFTTFCNFLAAEGLPGTLNPKVINFMQDSIKNQTGDYTVLDNANALANGTLKAGDLPAIRVWQDEAGKIWTLDHRRLGAFRLGGVGEVPVQWVD